MHDQMGINHTRLLQLVGDDATDKVGLSGTQSGHQVVQLLLVGGWYGGETTALLATSALAAAAAASVTGLTGMIGEDQCEILIWTILKKIYCKRTWIKRRLVNGKCFRAKALQMCGVSKSVQAQASSDWTQAVAQRRKALPVLQVPQALLSLRLL